MKSWRTWSGSLAITAILLALLGTIRASLAQGSDRGPAAPTTSISAQVDAQINYQGALRENGVPVNGTRNMTFRLFSNASCTSQVGSNIVKNNVPLNDGLFSVPLDVDPVDFDGQALWIGLDVGNTGVSITCHEVLPVPYALSLRPGANMAGEPSAWTESVFEVQLNGAWPAGRAGGFFAPSTGMAVYAESGGGSGIFGHSGTMYGVWGDSDFSAGGYFSSDEGYGVRVNTNGTDHWDHGAYVSADRGYGLYATSENNQGVRGEAGNVSGLSQPIGRVGVAGLGENRGVSGSSQSGIGAYGVSENSYGLWGTSTNYRGVTGRTSRSDNNYGFYTPDNFYSSNIHIAGAVMQVVQNGGATTLGPGDVVVFSGVAAPLAKGQPPLIQVARGEKAASTAVAGVVYSRFNAEAVVKDADPVSGREIEVTPAGAVDVGETLLMVIQGPALVNAGALTGDIAPGDLLSTSDAAGAASKTPTITVNGVQSAMPGTVFGKALEPLPEGSQGQIMVYVTLQ